MTWRTLTAIAGCFLAAGCASGGKNWWTGGEQPGSWGLELLVRGSALPVFEHADQSWVEGRWSERYAIRVHNRTGQRVEAVVSVDGRDVIDGRPAETDKRGYIIGPWSQVDIDGWRTSLAAVAAFRFTHPEDAYATRMGQAGELGVVRVWIFAESAPEPIDRPPLILAEQPAATRDGRGEQEARSAAPGLGTRFGERRHSAAVETSFERASSRPEARLQLRYDDATGLCRAGLTSFCHDRLQPLMPQPLVPVEQQPTEGFSEPPPGWEGHRW